MRERWELYDEEDKPTGEVIYRGERIPKGRFHRVVEAWLRTEDGNFILQKRSKKKKNYPGFWSCTACGSVQEGEGPEEAMIREMEEEMGIILTREELKLDRVISEFPAHYYIYKVEKDVKEEDIVMDPEEVEDFIFLTADQLPRWIEEKNMTKLAYYEDFFENWAKK